MLVFRVLGRSGPVCSQASHRGRTCRAAAVVHGTGMQVSRLGGLVSRMPHCWMGGVLSCARPLACRAGGRLLLFAFRM